MAYYFLFPEKDNTLYSHPDRSGMNAGGDEILELVKEPGTTDTYLYPSRILVQFKNDDLKTAISLVGDTNFTSSISSSVSLQLTVAETKNLVARHVLNAYAVSQSWTEGTGKYLNLPTGSNGCSWEFKDNSTTATIWTTSSFGANGGTGSIFSSSILTPGGGTWYTGSQFYATQQFLEGDSLDTDFDVKNIIHKFSASLNTNATYPTGIENFGFLIKTVDSVESNASSSFGEIQYFSSNTHTIYPPKLCFKWDDSKYTAYTVNEGGEIESLTSLGNVHFTNRDEFGGTNVNIFNVKKEYNQNDVAKIRIHIRDKYPTRTFATSSNFLNTNFFTSQSYYSIRDAHTEREIIPFNNQFTRLSSDDHGMFFKLYMKGLQPERYYRILLKHINNDGTTIYDDDYFFKVVR
tara:strand:+ start:2967 stop:4184 length:1218 start_codon:yes stop_codon:yes gene_type:complete